MINLQKAVLFLLHIQVAIANVEKVVFLGPSSVQINTQYPTLKDLQLYTLSPQNRTIRTKLGAEFPTNISVWGETSWLLLEQLIEEQRYEVRICWAATQPSSFRLSIYELFEVFNSPELISSLTNYSQKHQSLPESFGSQMPRVSQNFMPNPESDQIQSIILLQILAAADYYTTNRTVMENVPPVLVDIILDPYLLNIFPQSLIPTGVYLIIVAILSWILARHIAKWLQTVAKMDGRKKND